MSLTISKQRHSVLFHLYKFFDLSKRSNRSFIEVNVNNYSSIATKNIKRNVNIPKFSENAESIELIKNKYCDNVWSKTWENNELYIGDKSVACKVADFVCEDSKETYVFESNPGPGVLTESLLEAGIPNLRVFEKNEAFLQSLKVLSNRFPNRLNIIHSDIMVRHRFQIRDMNSENEETNPSFGGVPKVPWTEGIPCKFLGIISSPISINFMRFVFAKLSTMSSFFSYGRFQFFLLLSELEFEYAIAKPKENFSHYREITVFYNLFFDFQSLEKFPTSSFLPQRKSSSKKGRSGKYLHLVKLTPRQDLLTSIAGLDELPFLYFFIRHHLKRRKCYVISSLEQWIPDCGPYFIKEGMQVFTKFGDLSPPQILQLFRQFSAFPDYQGSSFQAAAKKFYERNNQHTL